MTAFGMTKRVGRSAANDDVLAAVLDAGTPAVCLVGKAHPFHVRTALGCTLDENLEAIRASVAHCVAKGREALLDAEHFFDGYRAESRPMRWTVCTRRWMRGRGGSCCAIPTAAPCPPRWGAWWPR